MKTATITWISYNNYGTLLQAYALQKAIEQLGHENVIISDREILKEWKAQNPSKSSKEVHANPKTGGMLDRLERLVMNPGRLSRIILMRTDREKYELPYNGSQSACEEFRNKELRILYGRTTDLLSSLNDQFDAFICGSDQIWSIHEGMFNPYYYLDFVTKKKISYAPSLGADKIPEEISQTIQKLLADYGAISVRESASAKQISSLTGRNVEWVADPTLLHDRQFWSEFTAGIPARKKKYLLCYFLENREWYFKYARKLAKKLNLKIVLIPNKWDFISSEYVTENGIGPKEFVSLIQHADFVLTDSYHGSIFSILFQRDFFYLLRFHDSDPNSQNIRINSLFDYLRLNNRIISKCNLQEGFLSIDNYDMVNKKLDDLRVRSRYYLKENL